MAVDGAVTPEEQNDIAIASGSGHAYAEFNGGVELEELQRFRRTSQPEDSSGAHRRGESSRKTSWMIDVDSSGDSSPRGFLKSLFEDHDFLHSFSEFNSLLRV